jgi:hypothetical protein
MAPITAQEHTTATLYIVYIAPLFDWMGIAHFIAYSRQHAYFWTIFELFFAGFFTYLLL